MYAIRSYYGYEDYLANENRLHPGVIEAFEKFEEHGIKLAILTRNSSRSVELFLKRNNFV